MSSRHPLTTKELLERAVWPPPRVVWAFDTQEAALAEEVARVAFEETKHAWEQLEHFTIPEEKRKLRRRFTGLELHQHERPLDAGLAAALRRKQEAQEMLSEAASRHQELVSRDRLQQQQAAREQEDREREEAARLSRQKKAGGLLSLLRRGDA